MAEISRIISSSLRIEDVYERFSEQVRKLIPFDRLSIGVVNAEQGAFTDAFTLGIPVASRGFGVVNRLEGSVTQELMHTKRGKILRIEEDGDWAARYPLMVAGFKAGLRCSLSVPLISRDQVIGAMHFQSTRPRAYDDYHLSLGERVGDQVAGAVANWLLFMEHTKAEEALRASEKRFRTLVQSNPDAVFLVDEQGKVAGANPRAMSMVGYTQEEMARLSVADLIVRYDPASLSALRDELAAGGAPTTWTHLMGKGGAEFPVEVRMALIELDGCQCILCIARDVTERQRAHVALVAQARELATLEERNRLAREIHDTLAQGFTGIVLQLEAAEQALEQSPADAAAHLSRAKSLARGSLQDARRSVWNLRPQALEAKALDVALQDEVREFNVEGKGTASFSVVGDKRPLPPRVETALLRICQECLTNILKHARATRTDVVLRFGPDSVSLMVSDNGTGFSVAQAQSRGGAPGMGLAGMEERAELLGGTFSVNSRPGEGTVIEAEVPTE